MCIKAFPLRKAKLPDDRMSGRAAGLFVPTVNRPLSAPFPNTLSLHLGGDLVYECCSFFSAQSIFLRLFCLIPFSLF
uniref:Uncharacterized protein n=1 Tax=Acrobeloides nanus TaxID=290746 RepID=A0A914CK00_9BILA